MIREDEVYKIGKIGKPHGVKGEVSLMFSDDVFDRVDADYLVLMVDGILVPFFFEEYRFKSGETALVKFCDIDTGEILIPAAEDFIISVEADKRQIRVSLPDGLLDLG